MTIIPPKLPSRRLAFVAFPGFQLLDATGPISAFHIAGQLVPHAYDVRLMADGGGLVASTSGIALDTAPLAPGPFDTILVVGGSVRNDFSRMAGLLDWLRAEAPRARRTTSVCTGAFFLAEAGLLEGRRATTHWNATEQFSRRYPAVRIDADCIYVQDGPIWTSGGITAGIDLALALIEEDLGSAVARAVAQVLVVHQRRAGGQSQHSGLLDLGGTSTRFAALIDWMRQHLPEPLPVERLAQQAAMSPRHFSRIFLQETGLTPSRAVERLRLEVARQRVETSRLPIDTVAHQTGFGSAERLRRSFIRAFGQPPQALRRAALPPRVGAVDHNATPAATGCFVPAAR